MNTLKIDSFNVIGLAIRTTNEYGQSAQDIPAFWNRFVTEDITSNIPNKTSEELYCIYAEYEKDHTRPYTTILGCKVSSLDNIPEGMMGITIDGGKYVQYIAKGNIMHGIVFNEWTRIWNSDLPRAFTADYEIYGEKAQTPENAEVLILIAVN